MSTPTPPERSEHTPHSTIRRILVAMDASRQSEAALEAAVDLAARLQAELLGLFVEDINLLRLAQLPFTLEVGQSSGEWRRLDASRLEQSLRAQARLLARQLTEQAARRQVSGEFRVVRGQVAPAVLAACHDADLLVLGRRGGVAIGRNVRLIIEGAAPVPVMLTGRRGAATGVVVLFDGGEPAYRALAAAAQLAVPERDRLVVLLPAASGSAEAASLSELAGLWLRQQHLAAGVRAIQPGVLGELKRVVEEERARLVVMPAETPHWAFRELEAVLAQLRCTLVLVRRQGAADAA